MGGEVSMMTPSLVRSENKPAFVNARTTNVTFEPSVTLLKVLLALVFKFALVNDLSSVV